MVDFYHYPAKNFVGEDIKVTISSGPVIIDEENKFLLHISSSTGKYQFTGGRLDDTKSPQENAIYRPFQDLGIRVVLMNTIDPLVIVDEIERDGKKERITLVHYLAKIDTDSSPTKGDWKWFTYDEIVELEQQERVSSPNIRIACQYFLQIAL